MSDLVSRIPAEQINACEPWQLSKMDSKNPIPTVGKNSQRLSKEQVRASIAAKAAEQESEAPSQKEPTPQEPVEAIEEVNLDEVAGEPMSAEHLQTITEAAEKEGFDAGFQKGIEEGKKEGIEKGIEEGREQGKQQEDERIQAHVDQLASLIDAFTHPIEKEQAKLEQQILQIVCELTRSMVKRELKLDSSIVSESVEQCLALLQNPEHSVVLHLNPQDIDQVKQDLSARDLVVTYEPDDSVSAGSCRLETKTSQVEVSLEEQLERLLEDFLGQQNIPAQANNTEQDAASDETDEIDEPDDIAQEEAPDTSDANSSEEDE